MAKRDRHDEAQHTDPPFGEVQTPEPQPPSGDIPVAGPPDGGEDDVKMPKRERGPASKFTKQQAVGKISNILKRLENPDDVNKVLGLAVDLLGK